MTSKEALEKIGKYYMYEKGSEIPLILEYKIIKQDLEVLDALKRNVGIRLAIQEWANKETKVFPNDRKIVKEWLDEKD